MCRQKAASRCSRNRRNSHGFQPESRAFFSIDSAFALLIALFSVFSFSLLSQAAASSALSQSQQESSGLLALRFSSYALEQAARQGEGWGGGHMVEGEIDWNRLSQLDLRAVLAITGRSFAGIYVRDGGGEAFRSESGHAEREKFCAKRLAAISGKPVLLEACIS